MSVTHPFFTRFKDHSVRGWKKIVRGRHVDDYSKKASSTRNKAVYMPAIPRSSVGLQGRRGRTCEIAKESWWY